jgi:hypothetical protein
MEGCPPDQMDYLISWYMRLLRVAVVKQSTLETAFSVQLLVCDRGIFQNLQPYSLSELASDSSGYILYSNVIARRAFNNTALFGKPLKGKIDIKPSI